MIINPKELVANGGFPPECVSGSDINGIRHAFLVERGFSFSSFADFEDVDVWIQAIKDGNIIALLFNRAFQNESEETKKLLSGQDFFYETSKGKYRFMHFFNYAYDHANNLKDYSQGNFDYIYADRNGNIIAYTPEGTTVQGFETDFIEFEKMVIGDNANANWTKLFVELGDTDQLDNYAAIIKPSWKITRNLNLVPVEVTNITEGSLKFRVTDSVYGTAINGLRDGDVIINDNSGTISYTSFKKLGNGYYLLDGLSGALTYGDVEVDTNVYYGSGNYVITSAPVNIVNLVFNALDDIEFDVQLASDSSAVTGLTIPDFEIDDNTHLIVSIGSLTESPEGHYRLSSLSNDLTTGDININSGTYIGTTTYDAAIDVEIYDFDSDFGGTAQIICKVRESISLNAVSGLVKTDFIVTDSVTGVLTVNNAVEGDPGEYTLSLSGNRTSGTVEVDATIYSGSDPYDLTGANFKNAGYTTGGATDWIDTDVDDGKADGVFSNDVGKEYRIYTPGGDFTGAVQQVTIDDTATSFGVSIFCDYLLPNTTYKAIVKFKSDANIKFTVYYASGSEFVIGTGDEFVYEIETPEFTTGSFDSIQASIGFAASFTGERYFEIDELRLEVIT